jgi:hypothetical protein
MELSRYGVEAMLEPDTFPIDKIYVPVKRRKALKTKLVQEIAESILEIGQQAPILVRPDEGRFVLVEGLHRLEACKALGENTIMGVSVSAEIIHGRKVFAETAEAEAEREKMVRLKRLRLETQAAARLAASAQVEVPEAQPERLARKHSQRTTLMISQRRERH